MTSRPLIAINNWTAAAAAMYYTDRDLNKLNYKYFYLNMLDYTDFRGNILDYTYIM